MSNSKETVILVVASFLAVALIFSSSISVAYALFKNPVKITCSMLSNTHQRCCYLESVYSDYGYLLYSQTYYNDYSTFDGTHWTCGDWYPVTRVRKAPIGNPTVPPSAVQRPSSPLPPSNVLPPSSGINTTLPPPHLAITKEHNVASPKLFSPENATQQQSSGHHHNGK
jgi:hypothetical protein